MQSDGDVLSTYSEISTLTTLCPVNDSPSKVKTRMLNSRMQATSEQIELVNLKNLREALLDAHQMAIQPELVSQLARPRLPELGAGQSIDPLNALDAYLNNREDLRDIAEEMQMKAEELFAELDLVQ